MAAESNNKEKLRLQMLIAKANAAKAELEFKIMERREDIQRMEDHMLLQDEEIEKAQQALKEFV